MDVLQPVKGRIFGIRVNRFFEGFGPSVVCVCGKNCGGCEWRSNPKHSSDIFWNMLKGASEEEYRRLTAGEKWE